MIFYNSESDLLCLESFCNTLHALLLSFCFNLLCLVSRFRAVARALAQGVGALILIYSCSARLISFAMNLTSKHILAGQNINIRICNPLLKLKR